MGRKGRTDFEFSKGEGDERLVGHVVQVELGDVDDELRIVGSCIESVV